MNFAKAWILFELVAGSTIFTYYLFSSLFLQRPMIRPFNEDDLSYRPIAPVVSSAPPPSIVVLDSGSLSPMIIFSSYFYYLTNTTFGFQTIGFSKCRDEKEELMLIVGTQAFPMKAKALNHFCPSTANGKSCTWVDYSFYAEFPSAVDRSQSVSLFVDRTIERIRVQETATKSRPEGLEVCVAPLFYFNHWVRIIEFIEIYRQQKASHFYIYVSSVSPLVMEMLKFYESAGLVTVVGWPELPKIDSSTESIFQLGQNSAIQDCLRRSRAKFVAVVDVDDYIVTYGKPLLNFVSYTERKNPNISTFSFAMVLALQKPHSGNLSNWAAIRFDGLENALVGEDQLSTKAIVMPEKVESAHPHGSLCQRKISGTEKEFQTLTVDKSKGVSYHTRYTPYFNVNLKNPNQANKIAKRIFSRNAVLKLNASFQKIMEQFSQNHTNLFTPATAVKMEICNSYEAGTCQMPYASCRELMENVDEWIFLNKTTDV